jgi:hypothetical protein
MMTKRELKAKEDRDAVVAAWQAVKELDFTEEELLGTDLTWQVCADGGMDPSEIRELPSRKLYQAWLDAHPGAFKPKLRSGGGST